MNIALLHVYREFNRVNGRHVMHPEDIKPVADEYQRYKVGTLSQSDSPRYLGANNHYANVLTGTEEGAQGVAQYFMICRLLGTRHEEDDSSSS